MARIPLRRVGIACLLVSVAATGGLSQRPAVLRGNVLNDATDVPIAGAEVAIPSLGLAVTTDSLGEFRLLGIPAGRQIVWVRRLGYSPVSAMLTFAAGDTVEREFAMARSAQPLPTVDVKAAPRASVKLQEFEMRRKEGFGHFVTPEMLEKHSQRQPAEIMALIAGPTVVRGTTNAAWIANRRGAQSSTPRVDPFDLRRGAKPGLCYSAVVLDGIFVYQGLQGEQLFDINSLDTHEIAGIEYYSGGATMPVKYNATRVTCGLVVIWTK